MQADEDFFHLRPGEDYGQFCWLSRALDFFQPTDFILQHFLVKKEQCAQRLILGGSSHVEIAREVSEKFRDFLLCHFRRMPFVVVNNEPLNPIDVSLLGANAIMLASNDVADQVEQFRFVSNWRDVYYRAHESDSAPCVTKLKPD